ncbi:MAG: zinc ribbon domain-containing protein [Firmicutes bacterium]|nr:zinc ribbon domain-containing protein [Bacillota bacterium]
MWDTIKNDPILRTVTIVILGLLGFSLLFNVLFGSGATWTGGGHEGEGGYAMGMQGTASLNGTLSLLLALIIKLLFVALIVGVVVTIALAVKQYLPEVASLFNTRSPKAASPGVFTCSSCGGGISSDFAFCPHCRQPLKEKCRSCGEQLQAGWRHCPGCGQEVKAAKPKEVKEMKAEKE